MVQRASLKYVSIKVMNNWNSNNIAQQQIACARVCFSFLCAEDGSYELVICRHCKTLLPGHCVPFKTEWSGEYVRVCVLSWVACPTRTFLTANFSQITVQYKYFRTRPLQCPCDVPQRLMFLAIIYDRSHAWDGHQRICLCRFNLLRGVPQDQCAQCVQYMLNIAGNFIDVLHRCVRACELTLCRVHMYAHTHAPVNENTCK